MAEWTKEKLIEVLEYTLIPSLNTCELEKDSVKDFQMRIASNTPFVAELFHENSKLNEYNSNGIITDSNLVQIVKEWYLSTTCNIKDEDIDKEKGKDIFKDIEKFSPSIKKILSELKRDEKLATIFYSVDMLVLEDNCIYRYIPVKNYLMLEKIDIEKQKLSSWTIPSVSLKGNGEFLFVIGVPWRNMVFYGQRGYRQMLFDAGIFLSRIQSIGNENKIDINIYNHFYDNKINGYLNLDGVESYVLSLIFISK